MHYLKYNKIDHNTHFISGANSSMFRHQDAIIRKFFSNRGLYFFYVSLNVHLSILILVINQLDVQNFCFTINLFHASTCFEHYVLIIRRSKLHYTASGIITPIGGRPVHWTAILTS